MNSNIPLPHGKIINKTICGNVYAVNTSSFKNYDELDATIRRTIMSVTDCYPGSKLVLQYDGFAPRMVTLQNIEIYSDDVCICSFKEMPGKLMLTSEQLGIFRSAYKNATQYTHIDEYVSHMLINGLITGSISISNYKSHALECFVSDSKATFVCRKSNYAFSVGLPLHTVESDLQHIRHLCTFIIKTFMESVDSHVAIGELRIKALESIDLQRLRKESP